MSTLVIFYSFSGKTKRIASDLAKKENADLFEVKAKKPYNIFTAFLKGAPAAMKQKHTEVADIKCDFSRYDKVIALAPIGVFGFVLYAAAAHGFQVFVALFGYAATVALALAMHALLVLPVLLFVIARRSPRRYAAAMMPALLTAFSTASSNGTLPLTMERAVEHGGVKKPVANFVLPLGATINMDGTALYEAVAALFIAQVYGIDLSLGQQLVVALTGLLVSVGAAGITHAGAVMMVVVLTAVGLPAEGVGLIMAVDRVLDMARTSVNVWSDSVVCAIVDRFTPAPPEACDRAAQNV